MAVSQGDIMFFSKDKKFVSMYPVLSAWQAEGYQVAFFYPSQNGHLTHTAVPSDRAGGQILGVFVLEYVFQDIPP